MKKYIVTDKNCPVFDVRFLTKKGAEKLRNNGFIVELLTEKY